MKKNSLGFLYGKIIWRIPYDFIFYFTNSLRFKIFILYLNKYIIKLLIQLSIIFY